MLKINTLQKGLIFHAPLDGEHLAKDVTPFGNHGTNNGATLSTGVKGEAEGSYSFDGVDYNITFPSLGVTNNFSVSWWIHPNNFTANSIQTVTGWNEFVCHTSTAGSMYAGINTATRLTPTELPSGTLELDVWQHFTFTFNGTIGSFYKNSELLASRGMTSPNTWNGFFLSNNIDGKIADLYIHNRALSQDEITLLYDSYKPKISTSSLEKGLVGHWALDNITGAEDLSGYGNVVIGNKNSYDYAPDGEISGAKLYNRALSADEVKLLYEKGR